MPVTINLINAVDGWPVLILALIRRRIDRPFTIVGSIPISHDVILAVCGALTSGLFLRSYSPDSIRRASSRISIIAMQNFRSSSSFDSLLCRLDHQCAGNRP